MKQNHSFLQNPVNFFILECENVVLDVDREVLETLFPKGTLEIQPEGENIIPHETPSQM